MLETIRKVSRREMLIFNKYSIKGPAVCQTSFKNFFRIAFKTHVEDFIYLMLRYQEFENG